MLPSLHAGLPKRPDNFLGRRAETDVSEVANNPIHLGQIL